MSENDNFADNIEVAYMRAIFHAYDRLERLQDDREEIDRLIAETQASIVAMETEALAHGYFDENDIGK